VLAAALLVITIGSCALSDASIRRGIVRPPYIGRQLGPVQVIATSTLTPECPLAFPCTAPLPITGRWLQPFYVIWVVVTWPDSSGPQVSSYRLLIVPLDE
jgi:hypothetical protein